MQVIHQRHFLMNRASQFSGILVWKCNKSALESINAIHQSWPDERKQILIKWQKKKKSLLFARNANNIFHHQRRWCLASNSWNCETVQCRYIVYMRSQDETGQYIKLSVIANIIQLLQISLVISSLIQIYRQISESLLIQLINKSEEEVKGVVKNSELPTSSSDHHYSCCLWAKNGALSDSHLYCHLPAYAPLLLPLHYCCYFDPAFKQTTE